MRTSHLYKTFLLALLILSVNNAFGQSHRKKSNKINNDTVYVVVEQMPQYPDGEIAMYQFIYEKIKISDKPQEEGLITRATVRFIVRKTGKVENVKAIGAYKDTDFAKSLVKVVESMPDWCVGKNNGQAVDVYYTLPLNIHIRKH